MLRNIGLIFQNYDLQQSLGNFKTKINGWFRLHSEIFGNVWLIIKSVSKESSSYLFSFEQKALGEIQLITLKYLQLPSAIFELWNCSLTCALYYVINAFLLLDLVLSTGLIKCELANIKRFES